VRAVPVEQPSETIAGRLQPSPIDASRSAQLHRAGQHSDLLACWGAWRSVGEAALNALRRARAVPALADKARTRDRSGRLRYMQLTDSLTLVDLRSYEFVSSVEEPGWRRSTESPDRAARPFPASRATASRSHGNATSMGGRVLVGRANSVIGSLLVLRGEGTTISAQRRERLKHVHAHPSHSPATQRWSLTREGEEALRVMRT
jgi:hypothetical protein